MLDMHNADKIGLQITTVTNENHHSFLIRNENHSSKIIQLQMKMKIIHL